MYCIKCGNKLENGDKFCTRCGTPVAGTMDVGAAAVRRKQTPYAIILLILLLAVTLVAGFRWISQLGHTDAVLPSYAEAAGGRTAAVEPPQDSAVSDDSVVNDDSAASDAEPAPAPQAPADTAPQAPADTAPPAAQPSESATYFDGVMGSHFLVPAGFVQQESPRTSGYYYSFYNAALDMHISVGETSAAKIIGVVEDQEAVIALLMRDYEALKNGDGVSYATAGKTWYVVSGTYTNDTIFYRKGMTDGIFLYSFDAEYPSDQHDRCDRIVEEFEDNFSI